MPQRFISLLLSHNSFALEFVCDFVIAASNKKIGVGKSKAKTYRHFILRNGLNLTYTSPKIKDLKISDGQQCQFREINIHIGIMEH